MQLGRGGISLSLKNSLEIEVLLKRKVFTKRELYMLFSLHLRPYKLNSYQIISGSESKMHADEIISIPGRNTATIIEIHIGGEEGNYKQFLYVP